MLHRYWSATLLFVLAGCSLNLSSIESTRSEAQSVDSPVQTLILSTINGSIDIQPHDLAGVELDIKYKAYGETAEEARQNCEALHCDISEDNGTLSVKLIRPSGQRPPSVSFRVKCPADCMLELDTSNGRVDVQGIQASVNAKTSNGGVDCKRLTGPLSITTSNGRINAADCEGSIKLQTSNGSVSWAGQLTGTNNTINTSNGKVTVAIPEDRATELEVKTSNGGISCDMSKQKIATGKKTSLQTVLGNSGDGVPPVKLRIQTSNGSVSIKPWTDQRPSLTAEAESNQNQPDAE